MLRNLTNRKLSEVKYLEGIYNGIEFLMKIGSRDEVYKIVKNLFGQYKLRFGRVENSNGKML